MCRLLVQHAQVFQARKKLTGWIGGRLSFTAAEHDGAGDAGADDE